MDSSDDVHTPKQKRWHDHVRENVFNPAINAAIIDPINFANSAMRAALPGGRKAASVPDVLPRLIVPDAQILSIAWFAQNLSGGLGSVVPYTVTGKIAQIGLRGAGCRLQLTGSMAAICKSEAAAQICGGAIYDALRMPQANESRFGNAVAGAVGFSIFESGNASSARFSLPGRIAMRGLVGTAGGAAQRATAEYVATGKLSNPRAIAESAASGALLNIFLPGGQLVLTESINRVNVKLGRGVWLEHYLNRYSGVADWRKRSPALGCLVRDSWSRVQPGLFPNYDPRTDLITVTVYGDSLGAIAYMLAHASSLRMRAQHHDRTVRIPERYANLPVHEFRSALAAEELRAREIEQKIRAELRFSAGSSPELPV